MNSQLARHVIDQLNQISVRDIILCPGARNIPLILHIEEANAFRLFYWYEERSAAFFALGRCRASSNPAAIITTSGTAAAELLPAAMEAYYTSDPLLLITADRPKRMRGTGAPQTVDQVGLFHKHITFEADIDDTENVILERWDLRGPAHLNVSFEEPLC